MSAGCPVCACMEADARFWCCRFLPGCGCDPVRLQPEFPPPHGPSWPCPVPSLECLFRELACRCSGDCQAGESPGRERGGGGDTLLPKLVKLHLFSMVRNPLVGVPEQLSRDCLRLAVPRGSPSPGVEFLSVLCPRRLRTGPTRWCCGCTRRTAAQLSPGCGAPSPFRRQCCKSCCRAGRGRIRGCSFTSCLLPQL